MNQLAAQIELESNWPSKLRSRKTLIITKLKSTKMFVLIHIGFLSVTNMGKKCYCGSGGRLVGIWTVGRVGGWSIPE